MIKCRKCEATELELTANGRVKSHPEGGVPGVPNCAGGSDLPRGVDHEVIQPMKASR